MPRVDKTLSKRGRRELRKVKAVSAAFLAPSFIGVLVFFILPFIVIIYYSLINNPVQKEFVGLDNFIKLFQNYSFKTAAYNPLRFSLVSVPLAVILSLLLAMGLNCKIPMQSKLRSFFLSPMMVPVASFVLIWQVLFHYNGTVNSFLERFGIDKIDFFKSDYCLIIIVLLFLWKNIGYNMILFMSALAAIPGDITEACMLDGAGPVRVFFRIKLPYISSTVLFVTILSLISSFKIFREVYLMTGRYPYERLYMLQHFMNNTFESLDYQKLSAAAIIMCAVMVVLIGALFLIDDKLGRDIES